MKKKRLPKWFEKFLLFFGGVFATHGVSYLVDYLVYPVVTYKVGFLKSFIFFFVFWTIANYFIIMLYDFMKKDLFGFEALKKMQTDDLKDKKNFLYKVLQWGAIPIFIALSFYDPIFAVIYKRDTTNFGGFKKRDYWILILSTAIGCFIWSGFWTIGIGVAKFLIGLFQ